MDGDQGAVLVLLTSPRISNGKISFELTAKSERTAELSRDVSKRRDGVAERALTLGRRKYGRRGRESEVKSEC